MTKQALGGDRMKYRIRPLMMLVICLLFAAWFVGPSKVLALSPASIRIRVDSNLVQMVDSLPFVENGWTYVPTRAVLEAYGVDSISWNAPFVIVNKGDMTLKIPIGQSFIEKNGIKITTESPALIKSSRTYLPIRAVIRALGGTTVWDPETKTVLITRSNTDISSAGSSRKLEISFIDVGQGESIFLNHNDTDILIDAGLESQGGRVVNYLKSQGVDDLELVVASHVHEDHIGGLPAVFDAFKVQSYLDSGISAATYSYKALESKVIAEGCLRFDDGNQILRFGDLSIQVIETVAVYEDLNDTSVVILVTYGNTKILLSGDAGVAVDRYLTKVGPVNLFKAQHHGSWTGNSEFLLSVLRPGISVISYGIGNPFGLPSQSAMAILKKHSGNVLWTAGKTVVISTDGNIMMVQ